MSVSSLRIAAASSLRIAAAIGIVATGIAFGQGCSGSTSDYHCDNTGCFQCDGYGCTEIMPAAPTACSLPGDAVCTQGTVCTDQGCLLPCKSDGQCAQGLVCRAGFCASPKGPKDPTPKVCAVASDCGASGFACVDGACVVSPPCSGSTCVCKYSSDCGAGRICVDGACGTKCDASAPCKAGLTCGANGVCVDGPPTCGVAAKGAACQAGDHCVDGRCEPGCAVDKDCKDPGLKCDLAAKACVPSTATAPNCGGAGDCSGGQKCVDGFCRFLCAGDAECLQHDVRIGACSKEGLCRAPSEVAAQCTAKSDCQSGKSCVDGSCK